MQTIHEKDYLKLREEIAKYFEYEDGTEWGDKDFVQLEGWYSFDKLVEILKEKFIVLIRDPKV